MKTILRLHLMLLVLLPVSISCQVNWIPQNSGTTATLFAVRFLDANNGFACGDAGTVIKTVDGGTTWSPINIGTSTPVKDIFFVSATEGWAACGDENNSSASGQIWYTTTGGVTWTPQTPSTTEARFGVSFANSTTGWVVGSRNGPINVDATTNGGGAWANQSDNNIFGWLYKIDALSTSTAFVIGGAFFPSVSGFIIKTVNGGTNWTQLNTGSIPFLNGIDMVNTTNGFVVGDAGTIMATIDGGTNWTTQTSGTTDTLRGVSFQSTTTGWAVGFVGTIRRTLNGGTTWTGENSGTTLNLNSVCSIDTTTAWAVGANGKIIKRVLGTGIDNFDANHQVSFYPNPMSASSTISYELPEGKEYSIVIYDLCGKEIEKINGLPASGMIKLTRDNLESGFYSYSFINNENTTLVSGKFIVN